jgi:hypothetical protein
MFIRKELQDRLDAFTSSHGLSFRTGKVGADGVQLVAECNLPPAGLKRGAKLTGLNAVAQ